MDDLFDDAFDYLNLALWENQLGLALCVAKL